MLRSSLTTASVVILGAAAFAQVNASQKMKPVTAPVRDGGTYHLATQTWTRKAAQSNVGADTVYNNTCSTGYYSPLSLDTYVDEGRIPTAGGPTNVNNRPGCEPATNVDGFQIAYCTDQTTATFGTYTVNFYESYTACATVIGVTPTAGFGITGLPASATAGTLACWIVGLDLDSPPQTASLGFVMQNDGDGTFTGTTNANLFGWSMATTAGGTNTGPLMAGDFNLCTGFDGTRWDTVINYAEQGTGMSTLDQFRIEAGGTAPGCYFFGGTPPASFFLQIYADACGVTANGTIFCNGDGVAPHTNCPCSNVSPTAALSGCLNSFGVGATMRSTGNPSISADTVALQGGGLPVASTLLFQGTTRQNSGNGSVFGDGLRCAGGSIARLKTVTASGTAGSATVNYPVGADLPVHVKGNVTAPGIRTYQAWYRNSASFCTAAVFNVSNGYELVWTL